MEQTQPLEHSLTVTNRKQMSISGVVKVVSIKPDLVQLKTSLGDMAIIGQMMEVTKLDLDNHLLNLSGHFCNIKYMENTKTPIFKKIFK